ncbi:hypothetical protein Btru_052178 [Bulinus truncatus]|nr:hypothetical protein Btru_052178 [Bulinus truncatus]
MDLNPDEKSGYVDGTLSYLQPSNLQELFQPGQSVITRLSKIDAEKQRFLGSIHMNECSESGVDSSLVLLKTYLQSRAKVHQQLFAQNNELGAYMNLKVGDVVQVIVNSVLKKGILCDTTCGAKGLVTKDLLGDVEPKSGKTYRAVVLFIDLLTPCIELTLDSKVIQSVLSHKENVKSQVKKNQTLKAKILLVKPEFILVSLRGHGNGKFAYVPVRQHLNDVDFNKAYKLGCLAEVILKDCIDEYQLAVFKRHDLELNTSTEEQTQSLGLPTQNTLVGTIFEAKIRTIHAFQMNVVINKYHGRVHITEVSDNVEEGENPFSNYHPEQMVKVKVIGLRDLLTHKYLPLTGSNKKHILLECSMKESKMHPDKKDFTLKYNLNEGEKVMAYVTKVTQSKVWAQISPCQQGFIDLFHLSADTEVLNNASSHFLPGQGYHATIIHFENDTRVALSLLEHEIKLAENEEVTAVITNIKCGNCFHVKLPFGRVGVVNQKPSVLHYVGQYIKCKIDSLKTDSDICALSLVNQSDLPSRKMRKRKDSSHNYAPQLNNQTETPKTKIKKIDNSKKVQIEVPRLTIDGFSWKGDVLSSDVNIDENSDSDDETIKNESVEIKKKRKHSEEIRIQEHEYDQIKNIQKVQSSADYEKLVLQSPNSSVIWIAYMTHHIELGETEKARMVAERALSTILFREEQEKLNIWVAYLNMETIYGDPGDVKKLLDRAVTFNNPIDIYLKMCDIYVANGNSLEAEKLFKKMTEKYKHEKLIWKSYGQFLFKNGQVDIARNSLQRALLVLDKRQHVEVIIKYATLEFSHGDIERGRTIFENLIASYPGRTDIWSVYVDMVVKAGDITGARHLMERAVKQKVKAKKLSFLIQKFKKFEETYGTEEQVEKVNELASSVLN